MFCDHLKEVEIGRFRALTNEERKYIRRLTWIQLIQLFEYLFLLIFSIIGIFIILIFLTYVLVDLENHSFFIYALG